MKLLVYLRFVEGFFCLIVFGIFLKIVLKVFLYDSCFMSEKMLYSLVYFFIDRY